MSDKKNQTLSNPFDLLLEEIDAPFVPVDLSKKQTEKADPRHNKRKNSTGSALIMDLKENPITKAALRDLSPTGAGFEIYNVNLPVKSEVLVRFSNSEIAIGALKCSVQWVTPIKGHPQNHLTIGLKFLNMSSIVQTKLNSFIASIPPKA